MGEQSEAIRANNAMISASPSQLGCPSFSESPLLITVDFGDRRSYCSSPAMTTTYMDLEGVNNNKVEFDPQDAWLPITESRKGNALYAAFHTLSSGIGFQALFLPVAFSVLGWKWGIICMSVAFFWQLYTLWLLVHLHESSDGTRYSRYLRLSMAAFGERAGKVVTLLPIMYLSGGTCVTLIMVGGGALRTFLHIVSGGGALHELTTVEWYFTFTCCAILLAQLLPNLNSIAGVSLIGAISAVGYCTMIWAVPLSKGRPVGVSYGPAHLPDEPPSAHFCNVLNAIGIIVLAFRGHNLVLEIQGTMRTTKMRPSRIPMWRGVKFSYVIIGLCLFSLAVGGFWTYGNLIHERGGMFNALYEHHGNDTSKLLLGFLSLLIVINCLSSFQLYAMPVFDNFELRYTSRMNKPCPRWVRTALRCLFGCIAFFISVAFPFLPSLAGLIGGVALPVTLAYPCLMWIKLQKPSKSSVMWWLNWGLGCIGLMLSVLLVVGAVWSIVIKPIPVHFFKPKGNIL